MSLTREEQLANLQRFKWQKEGQIHALKGAIDLLRKQKEREFKQLDILNEDIASLG